jgi:hypothetical protein
MTRLGAPYQENAAPTAASEEAKVPLPIEDLVLPVVWILTERRRHSPANPRAARRPLPVIEQIRGVTDALSTHNENHATFFGRGTTIITLQQICPEREGEPQEEAGARLPQEPSGGRIVETPPSGRASKSILAFAAVRLNAPLSDKIVRLRGNQPPHPVAGKSPSPCDPADNPLGYAGPLPLPWVL